MTEAWWEKDPEALKEQTPVPSEQKLSKLANLVKEMGELEADIELWESLLSEKKKELNSYRFSKVPDLMTEIGIKNFTTTEGKKVAIKSYYKGECETPEAYNWLATNGHMDIAKVVVSVALPMSEIKDLNKIRGFLENEEIAFTESTGVHHQTMKAWLRHMIEDGKPLDRELFRVETGFFATVENTKS